uniref:t-SNARE coiled-coil homology domain-containing protein n=1 Tax=Phaeomonas parva TaxID=124430 RepID=A0A7S1U751_9STRA|mmetsp:Transcript_34191/g.107819  ORF Transcript_34191/g.107819 Transcript_34191/m.107819 type:complete len:249 (+) Transcript_34191:293-1039(+)|eukprot:CAMPEP_0118880426 /NCGR_PEP_ID=MMETSP1163-20130328/20010_1 /TAXON_ID=124430 /ORGANISM="Phaeomonas parva, Strain CCMP2877" /LENGTH=248 /DNA_ID=CAMNT_0006816833 /DNA_START=224 /DNA_END=970 /DNA_ORIENTATION=+
MSSAASDPFYVFRDGLQGRMDRIHSKFGEAHDMLNNDSGSSGDFRRIIQKLKRELKHASRQLNDLEMTVRAVERERDQFQHIDDAELRSRKEFIANTSASIDGMTRDIESGNIKEKLERDEQEALRVLRPTGTLGAVNQVEMSNTNYIHDQQARTQLTLRQQDETLVELGESVDRVGLMADRINEELVDQNRMLNDFEADLDRAAEEMGFMMGKLAKLLKTKDTCQIWVILLLGLTIIVLGFMVIYLP